MMTNEMIIRIKQHIYTNLFLFLLTYRIVNSFLLKTIFEPDEIWQNIEPINFCLLNKGELTWDWKVGIRSMNNVLLYYVPCYIMQKLFPKQYPNYCFYVYKIINGVQAALLDYSTIKLYQIYHRSIDNIFFLTVISHALWLYSPRSHINSLEMSICMLVIFLYKTKSKKVATIMATYIMYLRPTSVLLIFTLYMNDLKTIFPLVPYAVITTGALISIDCIFYREFLVPPYNFYKINLQSGASDLFGKQSFFACILFLFVLTGALVFLAIRSFIIERKRTRIYQRMLKNNCKDLTVQQKIQKYAFYKHMVFSMVLFFMFYSLVPHKEMRFLLPLVPIINILAARMLTNKIRLLLSFQLFVSIFIGLTHQRYAGTIDYLQKVDFEPGTKILYAVCPYSLPAHSYICHKNVDIDTLTGEKDIFSKFTPRFYKRFGDKVVVNQYEKFIKGEYKTFKFDTYNYILLYDWSFEMIKEYLQNFEIVSKNRYCWVNFEADKGKLIYILKNRLK